MAKWLDKYEQGGLVLKKKTKDNYGTKPNVNDAKVSAGPGFEGDGYMAQNWRSPAWGGQFEMGGSLPGSVGFMYARTQNPAPANGKYTKKTLASAQVGMKMPIAELTPDIRKSELSTAIKSGTQNPTATNLETDSFGQAYSKARKQGKTKFSYQGKDYSTKYKGTPEEQLKQTGITDAQLHDRNIIQDQLAKNLSAVGYEYSEAVGALLGKNKFRKKLEDSAKSNEDIENSGWSSDMAKRRLDAFNLYSGLPQKYNTFSVSKNKPSISKDKDAIYYSVTNDKLRKFLDERISTYDLNAQKDTPPHFREFDQSIEYIPGTKNKVVLYDDSGVMGNFTATLGKDDQGDYVSYYDKWDIAPKDFGKPMEIYDKIYLKDLKTDYKPKMQNGGEMQYYQNGLDFNPKTISKNGKKLTKAQKGRNLTKILDLDKPMHPYISNDQIPSSATVNKEIARKAAYDLDPQREVEAAQRARDRQGYITKAGPAQSTASKVWDVLTHPMTALSYKTHGKDLPEHFGRGEHNILENAVNLINPFVWANEGADAIQDVNRFNQEVRDKGLYRANPNILASGALHAVNALPLAAEASPLIAKGLSRLPVANLSRFGPELQTAGINRERLLSLLGRGNRTVGASQAEANAAMEGLDDAIQRGATRRVQAADYAPYQPPTDAELLAMNEAEANRYFRRPSQQVNIEPVRGTQARGLSQQQIDDLMSREEYIFYDERGQEVGRSRDPNTRVEDFLDEEGLVRWQNRFNRAPSQAPKWGEKEFKIGDALESANHTDAEGNSFSQYVNDFRDYREGEYKIADSEGGYMKLKTYKDLNNPDSYLEVGNMTFQNDVDASAAKQFSKIMAHLPEKVNMGHISTSMYSQPLMNQQVARWANNNPGRIEVKNIDLETLNPWHKGMNNPTDPLKGYPKYGNKLDQIKQQFPKLQKTVKSMSQSTGVDLPEPRLEFFDMDLDVPTRRPITIEELNSPEFKRKLQQDPSLGNKVTMKAPTYTLIKHWRNGGHFIDPMGQWAYPGEITTIPSNDITMKGVNYDVMGISNTGDKKLMKPGKNYKFDGDYVTEYPRGGWLEKYK